MKGCGRYLGMKGVGGIWECKEVGRGGGKATDINSRGKLLGGGITTTGGG